MINKPHISVAPMMDWTDRHCRFFHRLLSPNARLYTEMLTTGALLHGEAERFLRFDKAEHPVALQLGGSDVADMAKCAEIGAKHGYDEININCGCPSDRVQKGRFGACLMAEPELVANCVESMSAAVDIPVTVKCRIGIDEQDSFEFLDRFVGTIAEKGCKTFIIHARKAWLQGLSPKQNRTVPVLDYGRVKAIKDKYPALEIVLNGGITSVDDITQHCHPERSRGILPAGYTEDPSISGTSFHSAPSTQDDKAGFDGFMIGREAYQNPYFLTEIEEAIFGSTSLPSREDIARAMIDYARKQAVEHGTPVKSITRHILGLYHNRPGAKAWKRTLSTLPYQDGADAGVIEEALLAQKDAAESLRRAA